MSKRSAEMFKENSEVYSKSCQTSKMKYFVKIVNG